MSWWSVSGSCKVEEGEGVGVGVEEGAGQIVAVARLDQDTAQKNRKKSLKNKTREGKEQKT